MDITRHVDGEPRVLSVDTRTTVLDALREQLGVTAPKKGCDRGQCGACTVLADGRRVTTCLSLAVAHAGATITTAAGLAPAGELHPVQQDRHRRRGGGDRERRVPRYGRARARSADHA